MKSRLAAGLLALTAFFSANAQADNNFVARLRSDGGPALFDAFDVFAAVSRSYSTGDPPMRFDCAGTRVTLGDGVIDVESLLLNEEPRISCERGHSVRVGRLSAGTWQLRFTGRGSDGTPVWFYSATYTIEQRGVACNADPDNHSFTLYVADADVAGLRARLANDPAWRGSVGNVVLADEPVYAMPGVFRIEAAFDPLADPYQVASGLRDSGFAVSTAFPVPGCTFLCVGNTHAEAVEYRRTDRDRYIFVTDPAERDALDAGVIAGWSRTGEAMDVISQAGNPRPRDGDFHPVFRFWGGSVTHEPSHFFTASQQECAVLRDRKEWNWAFERSGFWAYEWRPTGCPSGVPLYRTYNNGLDGAPAHRFSSKRSVIDEMVARGWVDEGPVMCVAGP